MENAFFETIMIDNLVDSPYQGRIIADNTNIGHPAKQRLKELANSINTSGLLQPISVRKAGDKYEIIDGHRRVEAHKLLGLKTIQAVIIEKSDREVQIMSVVANLQRTNLNNIEKAIAFQKILKAKVFKNKKELSLAIGKDETYVGDVLNLLNLDNRIISDIVKNRTTNDVRLLRLIRKVEEVDEEGTSNKQYSVYQKFKNEKLSRPEVLDLVSKSFLEKGERFNINGRHNKFTITFNETLSQEQQEEIKRFLEKKISENMDLFKPLGDKEDN